jgi:hypothetical protein
MADLFGLAKTVVEGTMTRVMSAMADDERVQKSVQRDLILISDEFEMMHSFLNDGAKDGVTDADDVTKTCVRQVRDMALDVEDCIDNVVHLDKESTRCAACCRAACRRQLRWWPWTMPSRA